MGVNKQVLGQFGLVELETGIASLISNVWVGGVCGLTMIIMEFSTGSRQEKLSLAIIPVQLSRK